MKPLVWACVLHAGVVSVAEIVRNQAGWRWWPLWTIDLVATALLLAGGLALARGCSVRGALSLLVCLSVVLQGAPALADSRGRAIAPEAGRFGPARISRLSRAWPPISSIYQIARLENDDETNAASLDRRIADPEARQKSISSKAAEIGMITGGAVAGLGASVALVC